MPCFRYRARRDQSLGQLGDATLLQTLRSKYTPTYSRSGEAGIAQLFLQRSPPPVPPPRRMELSEAHAFYCGALTRQHSVLPPGTFPFTKTPWLGR